MNFGVRILAKPAFFIWQPHMGPVGISDFRFWIRTLDFGFRILNFDLDFLPRFGFAQKIFLCHPDPGWRINLLLRGTWPGI